MNVRKTPLQQRKKPPGNGTLKALKPISGLPGAGQALSPFSISYYLPPFQI
jgi:hypothetical protein